MISNIADALIVVEEQAQTIEKLRQQIEAMQCCGNCNKRENAIKGNWCREHNLNITADSRCDSWESKE